MTIQSSDISQGITLLEHALYTNPIEFITVLLVFILRIIINIKPVSANFSTSWFVIPLEPLPNIWKLECFHHICTACINYGWFSWFSENTENHNAHYLHISTSTVVKKESKHWATSQPIIFCMGACHTTLVRFKSVFLSQIAGLQAWLIKFMVQDYKVIL